MTRQPIKHGNCTPLWKLKETIVMKEFKCSDMGYDCDWSVRDNDENRMMDQIGTHGREKHGLTEFTQDLKDKVRSKFHELKEKVA
jgi:predicted small metal-binding protein